MSYHQAARRQHVKPYLDARELERRIAEVDERKQRSLAWLEKYRASGRAPTRFDWRPRWAFTPMEKIDAEAREVLALTHAPSDSTRQGGADEDGGKTAGAGFDAAQQDGGSYQTPF